MDTEKKEKKQYDKEFKLNAVKLSLESNRSTASVARDLGVESNTLYNWKREYREEAEQAFPGKGNQKPDDEEQRRLKRRISDLEEENAILKKAMGYFSAIKK
jgi:transposase